MSKRFDEWNETKKITESRERKVGIKPRELFWVKIGQNMTITFIHLSTTMNLRGWLNHLL